MQMAVCFAFFALALESGSAEAATILWNSPNAY